MSPDLTNFALSFSQNAKAHGYIPPNVVTTYKIQDVTAVVWLRDGPYQVELFIVPPNYIIPEHVHPNVESYEMFLGGDISFSHSGRWVDRDGLIMRRDAPDMRGALVPVETNDLHGGAFGPRGGVFMSIQKWLNGISPHSVSADYTGPVMGAHHFNSVKSGDAVMKSQSELTWRDAAGLEEEEPAFMEDVTDE
jgi:hypothetical protein